MQTDLLPRIFWSITKVFHFGSNPPDNWGLLSRIFWASRVMQNEILRRFRLKLDHFSPTNFLYQHSLLTDQMKKFSLQWYR